MASKQSRAASGASPADASAASAGRPASNGCTRDGIAMLPAIFDTLPPFVRGEPFDVAIALGNVCGAFVYLLETSEGRRSRKLVYAAIAAVLGYGIAPEVVESLPWMPPMLAGALASALIVCALVAAFRQSEKLLPLLAQRIGALARRRLGSRRARRDTSGR